MYSKMMGLTNRNHKSKWIRYLKNIFLLNTDSAVDAAALPIICETALFSFQLHNKHMIQSMEEIARMHVSLTEL